MRSITCLAMSILVFTSGPAATQAARRSGAAPEKQEAASPSESISPDMFARRLLTAAELVLRKHIDPPTRQEMVLSAAKALARVSKEQPVVGLSGQVSELVKNEEFNQFLQSFWTRARKSTDASDAALQAAALEGLLSVVPGKPDLIPAKEFKVQQQIAGNRYIGIGIQLARDANDKQPVIINPFPRGPARLAGARPGDRILQIDGASTEDWTIEKTVDKLRGEEGTPLKIVVRQPGSDEVRTLHMTRGVIPFQSVVGYRRVSEESWDFRVDPSQPIAYLRIESIRINTLHELRQIARELESQEIRAAVLDLRFNSGQGDVQHAVLLADELLDEGPIGRVRDVSGAVKEYEAKPDSLFKRWPLAVLVNHYTRGEAEFVAAALQDNHRATIVGERTWGDGHISTPVELPDGLGAVTLWTGLMERADGRPLGRHGSEESPPSSRNPRLGTQRDPPGEWGVQPNHVVAMTQDQFRAWTEWRRVQDLPEPPPERTTAPQDPQLQRAVELLDSALKTAVGG